MARNHARIFTDIWNDPDFLNLSAGAQRLYLMLLSQQNLSHAGLLPLTVKRWANKAKNTTPEELEEYLAELEAAQFVVVDHGSEELLIRSFMRRDEVWKQLNVTKAACKDAKAIGGHRLRFALAREVARMRAFTEPIHAVQRELESLAEALPNPTGSPPEPHGTDSAGGTGRGSVTYVTTDSPSPTTSPAPATVPALRDDPTSELLIEHVKAYADEPTPDTQLLVKQQIMRQVAQGVPAERIRAGLARLREKRVSPRLLPDLITECSPVERPSTTDQRVRGTLALAAEYDAREQR